MDTNGYTTNDFRAGGSDKFKFGYALWLLLFNPIHYISAYNTYDAKISRFNQYTYQINRSTKTNEIKNGGQGSKCGHYCQFYN